METVLTKEGIVAQFLPEPTASGDLQPNDMKKRTLKLTLIGMLMALAATGCQKDPVVQAPVDPPRQETPAEEEEQHWPVLAINPTLESMVERKVVTEFTAGHEMGVYTDEEHNVRFAYNGTVWTPDKEVEIKKQQTVCCYYPYTANAAADGTVPVDVTAQQDWLFGKAVVTSDFPSVAVTMRHAMTLVRVFIENDYYQGEGLVTNVRMRHLPAKATLAKDGTLTPTGESGEVAVGGNYRIDRNNPVCNEAILLPVDSPAGIVFSADIDGKTCSFEFPAQHKWEAGYMYTYTLNIKGEYNTPVHMEQVDIDVEYWSRFGKSDEIVMRDCGDDWLTISTGETEYGYDTYRNEGKVFGVTVENFTDEDTFEGYFRFLLMDGDRMVEKFPKQEFSVRTWSIQKQACYVTAAPGTYTLVPIFQKKGESTWFKAIQMGYSYNMPCTIEEWEYEVKETAPATLPALRMMQLETEVFNSGLAFTVPSNDAWNLVYTLSNKGEGALRGQIKAVWEREFRLKSNSYRPGNKRKKDVLNDDEWADELGRVDVDIPAGSRFWRGVLACRFPVQRPMPTVREDVTYASPVVHLYWKAEGTEEWVLLRLDADFLFNRDYHREEVWGSIWDETTNYISIRPQSWHS